MCRKTLEGICSVHGVKSSGTLAAQLKKLKENGTIESRLFEWAEELRTMGNQVAHGVDVVISPEDARDTLEFTEALIEYVFTTEISSKSSKNVERRQRHNQKRLQQRSRRVAANDESLPGRAGRSEVKERGVLIGCCGNGCCYLGRSSLPP